MSDGQTKQVCVCDLSVADQEFRGNVIVENTDVIFPKNVSSMFDDLVYCSSSALRTPSNVMGCAPTGTTKTGKPEVDLARRAPGAAFRPRRARSDRALPRDSDLACARLLAAAIRSSSMVSVVLMKTL